MHLGYEAVQHFFCRTSKQKTHHIAFGGETVEKFAAYTVVCGERKPDGNIRRTDAQSTNRPLISCDLLSICVHAGFFGHLPNVSKLMVNRWGL